LMGLAAAALMDGRGLVAAVQAQTSGPMLADMLPLIVISSLGAFGLANHYQPFLPPHKSVVIYLFEPVLAAAFAWAFVANRAMSPLQIVGAGLILAANLLADLLPARFTGGDEQHPTIVPAATGGTT
jgi:drug/metabolite transporter (DMT)-like permease